MDDAGSLADHRFDVPPAENDRTDQPVDLGTLKLEKRQAEKMTRSSHDTRLSQAKRPTAWTAPRPASSKKMTDAEFDQHLLTIGLMSQLPDTASDFDDPDEVPVATWRSSAG